MAKTLNDILKGVNKSKEVPNDLTDLAMSPEGNKGEIDFAKKHKINKHEDRVGNGDDVYTASKIKTTKYKKQDQKVYEDSSCNHTKKGVYCEVHGNSDCSGLEPKDMPKGSQKVLLDKKVKEEVEVNEVAPPNPKIEAWIKANKERFYKQYGKEKGEKVLYAKAWKMHGQSESGDTSMQLNPAGSSSGVGPGGLLDLQRV